VSTPIAPGDTGKRRCHGPSPIASETYQQGAVTEAKVPDPVEAFLDFGTSRKSIGSSSGDYTVGWICALQVELDAARRMLDRVHARGFGHGRDCNLYTIGQIGNLNVVLICLPKGQYGTDSAAVAATRMINRFPKIEIGLMVGIGGGLPNAKNDVRLGDVVVGTGVVQYDMGKFTKDGFITTGTLKAPPEKLLHVLNYMPLHGSSITGQLEIDYPGAELDQLYEASYPHVGGDTCETCDRKQTVQRNILRDSTTPHVFYGTIASGNTVIKDSRTRETLIEKHGVVCCEMEAAGVMNTAFPCLVIRGISDYADSHKNDIWISYAAAAAAQYARDLLLAMPANIALSDTVS
jgi:nucleoside phosphorylase